MSKRYVRMGEELEDKCIGCIRLDPEMEFKRMICPKCHEETKESYLHGHTFVNQCTNCGDGYMSFSYYGNCEGQKDLLEYTLDFTNVSNEGLSMFAKRYSIKIITLMKQIRMNKRIRLRCELSEVIDEEVFFKSIGLDYTMDPPMPYSKFYTCKDAIRAKWFNSIVEVIFD